MKYLTLCDIKAQCRIEPDFHDEDKVLTLYGRAAEDTVLAYINRSYEDMISTYGEIPPAVVQATLMLVDASYQHRSPASTQQMYYVMYSFDFLIKPYIKLV